MDKSNDIISFNVGGHTYATSAQTVFKYPSSRLAQLLKGGKLARDSQGRHFLDRDGELFKYVIDFLRDGKLSLSVDFKEHERFKVELEFYDISALNVEYAAHVENVVSQLAYITICVRGTFAFGRDGIADVKFRKLKRILVCGNVAVAREVFGDSLNESRDPDRGDHLRYTSRFFLKHNFLEKAFDQLHNAGFKMVSSAAGGAGYDPESDETKWNHFTNYSFHRSSSINV